MIISVPLGGFDSLQSFDASFTLTNQTRGSFKLFPIYRELVFFLDQDLSQTGLPVRICIEGEKLPEIDDPGFDTR